MVNYDLEAIPYDTILLMRSLGAVFCLGDTNKNPVGKGNRRQWSDPSIYYTFFIKKARKTAIQWVL